MPAHKPTIMRDSPEAATPITIQAWQSSDGNVYLQEDVARYAGCTHVACRKCSAPVEKNWLDCEPCRDAADRERYLAMPRKAFDGTCLLYSQARNQYFQDLTQANESLQEGHTLDDLRLVLCEPNHGQPLSSDYFVDELPGDDEGDLPDSLYEAIDAFNEAVKQAGPLSWSPGEFAVDLHPPAVVRPQGRGRRE